MALLIVNPNPVFDRTIELETLIPGAVMRTLSVEVTAGGKGINVARVLRALGRPAPLLVPVGAADRDRYEHLLATEGADATLIDVPGSVRVASIYLEQSSARVTVVNDAGDPCTEQTWHRVIDAVAERCAPGDFALIMGSLPPGLPANALVPLVGRIHAAGATVLIDTAPGWLGPALAAHPDVVTPNLDEARAVLRGTPAHTMDAAAGTSSGAPGSDGVEAVADDACRAAADLRDRGAVRAIVTAGAHGVAMCGDEGTTWTPALRVEAVSTVGAGDSFVAGLADSWRADEATSVDWSAAVQFGIATSAASCEQVRAGGIDPARVADLHAQALRRAAALVGTAGTGGMP